MTHLIHGTHTHDDGHIERWSREQPGSAQDAHDQLAKRWTAAYDDFQRDRERRTLTRREEVRGMGLVAAYTTEIRHEDI